ncbi:leucine-rich repeat and coiled-coil domain-containing protein 1-like isoform X2 [Oscarella lobularis]|uniref:leucine-rich repeat and coiled-coil domain-containing protein 1-like isoform X2 n=1 Tax=Oscarella lobularis TaxID=121494 RepID=UPI0033141F36
MSDELSIVDAHVTSMGSLPLVSRLVTVNLHCNSIVRMENLDALRLLTHLDLSSNKIKHMTGMDNLASLRTLNLACNRIGIVEGLKELKRLKRLDLSFNRLTSVSGLGEQAGSQYSLQSIFLHGNQIRALDHVIQSISGLEHMRELSLRENPLCKATNQWRSMLLASLYHLEILDGVDHKGKGMLTVSEEDNLEDIPGIQRYLKYLRTSSSAAEESSQSTAVNTPHIDEVLEKHRSKKQRQQHSRGDDRLKELEEKLIAIASQQAAILSAQSLKEVEAESGTYCSASEKEKEGDITTSQKTRRRVGLSSHNTKKSSGDHEPLSPSSSPTQKRLTSVEEDKRRRNAIARRRLSERKATTRGPAMSELIAELDEERDRRFKAEQAARKLVEHLKLLEQKVSEQQQQQETVLVKLSQLQLILRQEKQNRANFQDQYEKTRSRAAEMEEELSLRQEQLEEYRLSLKDLETATAKLEAERLQEEASWKKSKYETQTRLQAMKHELELSRASIKQYKEEVEKLQQLLAAREQEHRVEMAYRIDPNRPEIKAIVRLELEREKERFEYKIKHLEEKLREKDGEYIKLEDEFRMALHIEEKRFQELQAAFEKAAEEGSTHKRAARLASEKEAKASAMLAEMTTMIKEQKERIAALSKSRKEAVEDYKGRWDESEANLQKARKELVRLTGVEEEKGKLMGQIAAQESVIEGLRQERKLWGHELAQQGANLAQDRGRMESEITSLQAEVTHLKRQTERDADTILIKSKMLEDQTNTIRQLKQTVAQHAEELSSSKDQSQEIYQELESQNRALQDRVEVLQERKEDLKLELATTKEDLDCCKSSHKKLKEQWDSRLEAFRGLEIEMQNVKETFASKIKELTDLKRKAEEESRAATSRLRSCDDAFRRQLDAKEQSHETELDHLRKEMQLEVDIAHRKVADVEDEMRVILTESAKERKQMESRLLKLSRAFQEVEQGLD